MKILEIVVRYQPDPNPNEETFEMYLDPAETGAIFFNRDDACCFAEQCKEAPPCEGDDGCGAGSKRRIAGLTFVSYGLSASRDAVCVWDPRTGRVRCTNM